MSSQSANCFKDSKGTFYFRVVVPKKLRYFLGITEIRRSLKTHLQSEARKKLWRYREQCEKLFDLVEEMMSKNKFVDLKNLPKTMVFRTVLNGRNLEFDINTDKDKIEGEIVAFSKVCDTLGIKNKEQQEILSVADHSEQIAQPKSPELHAVNDFTMREAVDIWLNDLEMKLKPRTISGYRGDFYNILPIIGEDRRVSTLTIIDAQNLNKVLSMLPAYWTVREPFAGKSIATIIAQVKKMKKEGVTVDLIGARRLNAFTSMMSSWSKWAIENTALKQHVFKGFNINKKTAKAMGRSSKTKKRGHSEDELTKIFDPTLYGKWRFDKPWKYWTPILAAYTGLRIEEICGLSPYDFYQNPEGIWFLEVREEIEDWKDLGLTSKQAEELKTHKSVKTTAGERHIPIHSRLCQLGLIDFVQYRRKEKEIWLFDLKATDFRRSHRPVQWFSQYRDRIGIFVAGQNFHVFRRNMATQFKIAGVEPPKMRSIMGHDDEDLGYKEDDGYADRLPIEILKSIIEILKFPALDNLPKYGQHGK